MTRAMAPIKQGSPQIRKPVTPLARIETTAGANIGQKMVAGCGAGSEAMRGLTWVVGG